MAYKIHHDLPNIANSQVTPFPNSLSHSLLWLLWSICSPQNRTFVLAVPATQTAFLLDNSMILSPISLRFPKQESKRAGSGGRDGRDLEFLSRHLFPLNLSFIFTYLVFYLSLIEHKVHGSRDFVLFSALSSVPKPVAGHQQVLSVYLWNK